MFWFKGARFSATLGGSRVRKYILQDQVRARANPFALGVARRSAAGWRCSPSAGRMIPRLRTTRNQAGSRQCKNSKSRSAGRRSKRGAWARVTSHTRLLLVARITIILLRPVPPFLPRVHIKSVRTEPGKERSNAWRLAFWCFGVVHACQQRGHSVSPQPP